MTKARQHHRSVAAWTAAILAAVCTTALASVISSNAYGGSPAYVSALPTARANATAAGPDTTRPPATPHSSPLLPSAGPPWGEPVAALPPAAEPEHPHATAPTRRRSPVSPSPRASERPTPAVASSPGVASAPVVASAPGVATSPGEASETATAGVPDPGSTPRTGPPAQDAAKIDPPVRAAAYDTGWKQFTGPDLGGRIFLAGFVSLLFAIAGLVAVGLRRRQW